MSLLVILCLMLLAGLINAKSFFVLPRAPIHYKLLGTQVVFACLLFLAVGSFCLLLPKWNPLTDSPFLAGIAVVSALITYTSLLPPKNRESTFWASTPPPPFSWLSIFKTAIQGWLIIIPLTQILSMFFKKLLLIFVSPSQLAPQVLTQTIQGDASSTTFVFGVAISVLILAPVAEEILFRGFLQNYFKQKIDTVTSLIISSLIFSLLHVEQSLGCLIFVPALFVLSLMLGFVYEKERNILAPILLHSLYNATHLFSALFWQ